MHSRCVVRPFAKPCGFSRPSAPKPFYVDSLIPPLADLQPHGAGILAVPLLVVALVVVVVFSIVESVRSHYFSCVYLRHGLHFPGHDW